LRVEGLKAEQRKQGVVLSWIPDQDHSAVRLQRKSLTLPVGKPKEGPFASSPEPARENLLVDEGTAQGRAMDTSVHMGERYEYRAQRVSRVEIEGKTLELGGELSPPIEVEVKDMFPPEVPVGLVAVATAQEGATGPAIDLSWQADLESALQGYVVFRRDGDGPWTRISPETPAVAPAFHDVNVQPGHTYRYAVSAVDKNGKESARSVETQETVPQP
jgi:hypothetical protein